MNIQKRVLLIALTIVGLIVTTLALTQAAPTKTEMVPMRDGVKLVTDIYLPEGNGKFPTILMRTPYPRDGADGLAKLGFASVIQSTRGRYGSEGKDMVFLDDAWGKNQDGYDTVEWIAKQPWSNGDVGTFGGSALGITQYLMAGTAPPHLKVQCAIESGSNLHPLMYQGGAFRKELVENWTKACGFTPDYLKWIEDHPSYDDSWRNYDLSTRFNKVNVPILHFGGWYDIFQQDTIDTFVGIQNHGAKGALGRQKLIIGPYVHGPLDHAGEFVYPNATTSNQIMDSVEWLSHYLKDQTKALSKRSAVTYYTMGAVGETGAPGNEWRSTDVWPVPAKDTPFYLHADGSLSETKPTEQKASKTYVFDPDDPVPSKGGNNLTIPSGPMDQRAVENRADVMLFTTAPLDKPIEVTGRINVKLWASSSAKDTDFTAKLTDVYPDGRSMLLCDGIIRARYRDSLSNPTLITPGKVYEFTIDLWSTSMIFNKGHRIRLAISSSNTPRFDVNPNTGEPMFHETHKMKASNTVYFDPNRPSAVHLPVIR